MNDNINNDKNNNQNQSGGGMGIPGGMPGGFDLDALSQKDDSFFAKIFSDHPFWALWIYNQPCLVFPSTVGKGATTDKSNLLIPGQITEADRSSINRFSENSEEDFVTRNFIKNKGPLAAGMGVVLREIVGLFVHNPWLYWKQTTSLRYQDKWRMTIRDPVTGKHTTKGYLLLNPITKLIFCVFKVFGSPLILVYFALKFFYVFFEALNIHKFGKQFLYSIPLIFPFFMGSRKEVFYHDEYTELEDGSFQVESKQSYPFVDLIMYYIGMIIPLHMTGNRALGETYGKGVLGAIILFFMAISAILIIVTGVNMLFIVVIFIVYIVKTIMALKTSAMGTAGGNK